MKKITILTLASATTFLFAVGASQASENTDKVVAKMAKGDVTAICQGGRPTIKAASTEATTSLAQAGKISGDFKAIGAAAGTQFYNTKC